MPTRYHQALGRLFARALQLHPRNAGLWIKAASWEMFDAGNSSSARALMQRGLRINPGSRSLLLQYFRLEFCYVQKLAGRREVLGLEGGDGDGDGAGGTGGAEVGVEGGGESAGRESMDIPELEAEEGQGGDTSLDVVKQAAEAAAAARAARPAPVMNAIARRFYKGAVPLAVYRAAIKAVPGDVGFRAEFLRCCVTDFPSLGDEVAGAVLSSIAQDFPESCEAWEVRALHPLLAAQGEGKGFRQEGAARGGAGNGVLQQCVKVFELAVETVGAREPEMWVRYASFLRERLEALTQGEGGIYGEEGGRKKRRKGDSGEVTAGLVGDGSGSGGSSFGGGISETVAAAVALQLQQVLTRAAKSHLSGNKEPADGSPPTPTAAQRRAAASTVATTAEGASGGGTEDRNEKTCRSEDAREALSAGLADVCLARGEPGLALEALRAATVCLPSRAGPWLRRAALERRLALLGLGPLPPTSSSKEAAAVEGTTAVAATDTLREGLKSVPPTARDYPKIWRELLGTLVAAGAGKKAIAAAFRAAVGACDPTGADEGIAQGEFLAGYLRWIAAAEGAEAARGALRWARRSFLLAGAGAAAAYGEAIELEKMVSADGGTVGASGSGRAKRLRELYEASFVCVCVGVLLCVYSVFGWLGAFPRALLLVVSRVASRPVGVLTSERGFCVRVEVAGCFWTAAVRGLRFC